MKYNTKIYNLLYKPYIEVDSNLFIPIYTKSNIVKDGLGIDTGDNISDKNYLYTEYSYFYWILKNTELPDKIGFFIIEGIYHLKKILKTVIINKML